MSCEHTFLRMPDSNIFSDWDYFVNFVNVEVATCSVIIFEQRHHSSIPTLQYSSFPRIRRIKVYSGFCSPNWRSGHSEFYLHCLCQRFNFTFVEADTHTRSPTRCSTAQ